MKRNTARRFIAMTFAVLMFLTVLPIPAAGAFQTATQAQEQEIKAAKQLAELFAVSFDKTLSVTATDVVPIYSMHDELVGYMVSYSQGRTPYGYVVFDLRVEGLISEFVINEGSESMYTQLQAEASVSENYTRGATKLISIGALQYAVEYTSSDSQKYYYDRYNREFTTEQFNAFKATQQQTRTYVYDHTRDVIFNASQINITTGPHYIEQFNVTNPSASLVSENEMIQACVYLNNGVYESKYACYVAALGSIVLMEGILYNNNLRSALNLIWETTETEVVNTGNVDISSSLTATCLYGTTYDNKIPSGIREYSEQVTDMLCSAQLSVGAPTETFYHSAVNDNAYSMFMFRVYTGNENDPDTSGHGVCVVGYAYSGTSMFLAIGDGWNDDAPRFISLNNDNYVQSAAPRGARISFGY